MLQRDPSRRDSCFSEEAGTILDCVRLPSRNRVVGPTTDRNTKYCQIGNGVGPHHRFLVVFSPPIPGSRRCVSLSCMQCVNEWNIFLWNSANVRTFFLDTFAQCWLAIVQQQLHPPYQFRLPSSNESVTAFRF